MTKEHFLLVLGVAVLSFALSFFGATVGFVLGHFRLPLLISYLGSAAAGSTTNLAISGLGAVAGAYRHAGEHRVSLRVLALTGIPSAIGAVVGVLLFLKMSPYWAQVFIGALLVVAGLNMALSRPTQQSSAGPSLPWCWLIAAEIAIGLVLGALASVTGLMLSSLRLPALVQLLKLDLRVAVGTNMAIGCVTACAGATTSWLVGGGIDLLAVVLIGAPTMLGGYLGAKWTGRLKKETMQRLVGGVVVVMGLLMASRGLTHAVHSRDPEDLSPAETQTARAAQVAHSPHIPAVSRR